MPTREEELQHLQECLESRDRLQRTLAADDLSTVSEWLQEELFDMLEQINEHIKFVTNELGL